MSSHVPSTSGYAPAPNGIQDSLERDWWRVDFRPSGRT